VFDIDLEHCPHCGGALKIIAARSGMRDVSGPSAVQGARLRGRFGLVRECWPKEAVGSGVDRKPQARLTSRTEFMPNTPGVQNYYQLADDILASQD
jgi:hypothetical protein